MRSDARIVLETMAEYWNDPQFLSDEYPEPQYHGDQVALVRAGRLAGLRFAEEWLASVNLNENGKRVHMIIKDEIAELEGEDGHRS